MIKDLDLSDRIKVVLQAGHMMAQLVLCSLQGRHMRAPAWRDNWRCRQANKIERCSPLSGRMLPHKAPAPAPLEGAPLSASFEGPADQCSSYRYCQYKVFSLCLRCHTITRLHLRQIRVGLLPLHARMVCWAAARTLSLSRT